MVGIWEWSEVLVRKLFGHRVVPIIIFSLLPGRYSCNFEVYGSFESIIGCSTLSMNTLISLTTAGGNVFSGPCNCWTLFQPVKTKLMNTLCHFHDKTWNNWEIPLHYISNPSTFHDAFGKFHIAHQGQHSSHTVHVNRLSTCVFRCSVIMQLHFKSFSTWWFINCHDSLWI